MRKAKLCEKSKREKKHAEERPLEKRFGFTFVQGCLVSVAKKGCCDFRVFSGNIDVVVDVVIEFVIDF